MADARFRIVNSDAGQQLILPMPSPYIPIPMWIASTDLLAIILVPVWAICSGMIRTLMRIEPPPRARFTIAPDRFEMELVAHDTGERTTFNCDPTNIVEIRKNRYEKGLWIHIQGKTMQTYLQDVDDVTIHAVSQKLRTMLSANGLLLDADNSFHVE